MTKKYSIMLRNINQGPGQIPFFQLLELKFDKQATHSLFQQSWEATVTGGLETRPRFSFQTGHYNQKKSTLFFISFGNTY